MGEYPHAPPTLLLGPAPAHAAFPAGLVGGVPVSLPWGGPSHVHVRWTPSLLQSTLNLLHPFSLPGFALWERMLVLPS